MNGNFKKCLVHEHMQEAHHFCFVLFCFCLFVCLFVFVFVFVLNVDSRLTVHSYKKTCIIIFQASSISGKSATCGTLHHSLWYLKGVQKQRK